MLDIPSAPPAGADYATVKSAIEFISTRYREQPSIEAIAGHVGLSPSHFQHVFKRWAGLDAESLPAGDHARAGAGASALLGKRPGCGL